MAKKRRLKGEGSIRFDKKRNLFVVQRDVGYDENGNRKRKTVYARTKAEAQAKLKNIEMRIYTGTFVDESNITIYHLAKQILIDKLNQNIIKEQTYYRNLETLKMLKSIYNTPLQDCNETQIREYFYNKLSYSDSVIKKIYSMLNQTFKEARKRKIIVDNPMEFIKIPKSKQQKIPVRALTKDEQRKLIDVLINNDINYKNQMLLSLVLGMRMGEINALDISDIYFPFNQVYIHRTIARGEKGEAILSETTKTDAGTRILVMSETARELLKECIKGKNSGLVFTHNDKMITTNQVYNQFMRILKKYDILDKTITNGKIDLNSLRHTFGTRCVESGMKPEVLKEIMGHTDIRVTMNTYYYATTDHISEHLNKVDNILKAEGLTLTPHNDNKLKAVF